jgi:hypothetical protein
MRTEKHPAGSKRPKPKRASTHGRPFTFDDPLFKLLGSARSAGPSDVSQDKQKYLAQILGGDRV